MLPTLIILGVMTSTLQLVTAALPEGVEPCPRSDPHLEDCIKRNLEALIRTWKTGSAVLGIPSLDPQQTENITVSYRGGFLDFDFFIPQEIRYFLSDTEVVGVRSAELTDTTLSLEVALFRHRLYETGAYNLNATFWGQGIASEGNFRINITNVMVTWRISGKLVTVAGQEYMQIQHFLVEPLPETMTIFITNLLPGERFNWLFMQLINRIWYIVTFIWLPSFTAAWDAEFTELANKVSLKIPYDESFPK